MEIHFTKQSSDSFCNIKVAVITIFEIMIFMIKMRLYSLAKYYINKGYQHIKESEQ